MRRVGLSLLLLLASCASPPRPAPSERAASAAPARTAEGDAASIQACAQRQRALGAALERPGPEACAGAADRVGEICALSARICAIASRRGDAPGRDSDCSEAADRCAEARARRALRCPAPGPVDAPAPAE